MSFDSNYLHSVSKTEDPSTTLARNNNNSQEYFSRLHENVNRGMLCPVLKLTSKTGTAFLKTSPETSSPFDSGLNKSRGTEAQVVVQVDQVRNRCMFLNVILILEC